MFLDCDTTPPLRSRYVRAAKVDTAVKNAKLLMASVEQGQIGLYTGNPCLVEGFAGYVVKYTGSEPYFEASGAERS